MWMGVVAGDVDVASVTANDLSGKKMKTLLTIPKKREKMAIATRKLV